MNTKQNSLHVLQCVHMEQTKPGYSSKAPASGHKISIAEGAVCSQPLHFLYLLSQLSQEKREQQNHREIVAESQSFRNAQYLFRRYYFCSRIGSIQKKKYLCRLTQIHIGMFSFIFPSDMYRNAMCQYSFQ